MTNSRRDDLIVVTVWTCGLCYALVSNLLVLFGVLHNEAMRKATTYWFIVCLAVCDIVMVLISLFHLVPAIAFHEAFVEMHSWRTIWVIFFYDLFWYIAVLGLGSMALNRFASIVYPMDYRRLFSPRRTALLLLLVSMLGLAASLPTLFPCCHTLWDPNNYITSYSDMDTWYKYVDMLVNTTALVIMVFCYSVIIHRVRESGKTMARYRLTVVRRDLEKRPENEHNAESISCTSTVRPPRRQASKKEIRLFVQFFIVSVVFLLTWTTWQWLPRISSSKWAYFCMTSLFFINNSVNPTVYMIFNSQLRREISSLVCRKWTSTTMQEGDKMKGNRESIEDEDENETSGEGMKVKKNRLIDGQMGNTKIVHI